jgi:hypothetical protein
LLALDPPRWPLPDVPELDGNLEPPDAVIQAAELHLTFDAVAVADRRAMRAHGLR